MKQVKAWLQCSWRRRISTFEAAPIISTPSILILYPNQHVRKTTMEHLPLELVSRIIHFASEADSDPDSTRPTKPRLAYLALVSKQWRDVIESRTFGSITLESSELDAFAKI